MRERLNISPGTPLISSQMGEVQGGTPTWAASQVIDTGSPPPVIRRRAVLSQGHVPRAAAAVPKFIREMQVTLGTAPNVDILQMTTIPGDVQVGAPSQMSMAPRTFFGYPWSSKACSSVSAIGDRGDGGRDEGLTRFRALNAGFVGVWALEIWRLCPWAQEKRTRSVLHAPPAHPRLPEGGLPRRNDVD